jgi:hypothetical protein
MINVQVNKDFAEYTGDFFKGFSFIQTIFGVITVLIAAGAYILLYISGIPSMICVYVGVFLGLPVGFIGFFKMNGMGLVEYLVRKNRVEKSSALLYVTEEMEYLLEEGEDDNGC